LANSTEITPVVRRVACDQAGRAQLVFTLSNVLQRAVDIEARVLSEPPLDPGWFVFRTGARLKLAARSSAQLIIDAQLAPQVPIGNYRLRLQAAEAATKATGPTDTSPSVLLQVSKAIVTPQVLPSAAASTELTTDCTHGTGKPERSWLMAGLGGLVARLLGQLRRLLAPVLNWFWGGQPAGARSVDTAIVKRALILIAIIYVLTLAPRLLSLEKPVAFPEASPPCDMPLTLEEKKSKLSIDEAIEKRLHDCVEDKDPIDCAKKIPCFSEKATKRLESILKRVKPFVSKPECPPKPEPRATPCNLFQSALTLVSARKSNTDCPSSDSPPPPKPPRIRIE
jgi:hypothetical protein